MKSTLTARDIVLAVAAVSVGHSFAQPADTGN